jgi:glycosyltransferase involved in cell wall biosynthesis/SAM-dependent methyltransferase
MRLIYLTAKKYPGSTADHRYLRHLAVAFHRELGGRFTFVACNTKTDALPDFPVVSLSIPLFIKRTLVFFFWIPRYWFKELKKGGEPVVFFSNDFNLLTLLIIWKRMFRLSYNIVADWHLRTYTWKDWFIAWGSDCCITTSFKLEQAIRQMVPLAHVQTVHGGVALEAYKHSKDLIALRDQLGLPQKKVLVGYIGLFTTMGMEKGISTMIDALSYLDRDSMMVFVGGRQHEIEHYQAYAHSKNVSDRCRFVPLQPFDQVVQYEQAMDMLIIPYPDKPHFRQYGFPMKVYEYMASGVPIIYTKLELAEEVLSDCAFGVTPDDPQALAAMVHYVRNHMDEARAKAMRAFKKIKGYTWEAKAQRILQIFAILPVILTIPDAAVKYILFQRTAYLIYQNTPWLNKIIIHIPFLTYNHMVLFEAWLFRKRIKRLFSEDIAREYAAIKNFLPEHTHAVLDIGCGVAGIDVMLYRHYKTQNRTIDLYLLDETELNQKVYYGFEKKASFYNSLSIAKLLLASNRIESKNVHVQEINSDYKINFSTKFDLVISLISWGFHYPVSTYLDQVYNLLKPNGVLIMDIRKGTGEEKMLKDKFHNIKIISEGQKYMRIVTHK